MEHFYQSEGDVTLKLNLEFHFKFLDCVLTNTIFRHDERNMTAPFWIVVDPCTGNPDLYISETNPKPSMQSYTYLSINSKGPESVQIASVSNWNPFWNPVPISREVSTGHGHILYGCTWHDREQVQSGRWNWRWVIAFVFENYDTVIVFSIFPVFLLIIID